MATAASRRSSGRSRLVASGAAAGLAALVALVLVSFLWPRDDNPRRAAVVSYLEGVDAVERESAIELQRAGRVYARLGDAKVDEATQLADAERAERAITDLERRARRLRPPAEAVSFHRRLLALLALQSSLARDATALVRYLPSQQDAQRAMALAVARLARAVAAAGTPAAQASVFRSFEDEMRRIAASLEAVPAPALLEPLRRAARARASGLASVARSLRGALGRGDARRIEELLGELGRLVARGTGAAERDAVIAYNRQVDQVGRRHAAVQAELTALDRALQ